MCTDELTFNSLQRQTKFYTMKHDDMNNGALLLSQNHKSAFIIYSVTILADTTSGESGSSIPAKVDKSGWFIASADVGRPTVPKSMGLRNRSVG